MPMPLSLMVRVREMMSGVMMILKSPRFIFTLSSVKAR